MIYMKRKITFLAILLFGGFMLFAQKKNSLDETINEVSQEIASRSERKEIIAVLNFTSETEEMSNYINSKLIEKIFENTTLQVVTRQNMDKVEKELKFQSSGLVSDSTALSIAERLGAHKIIFGSLEELDNKYSLQVKMLDVKSASYSLFKSYEISRSSKTEQLLHHAATIYKSSIGFIFEANKNSISVVSPATGISFDYSFLRKFSLGIKTLVSYDFFEKDNSIYAIEPLLFARWYAVSPSGEPSAGLFLETQIGPEILLVNSSLNASVSIGGTIGFRIANGNFYLEPFLRGGYPYIFGAGINAGFRF